VKGKLMAKRPRVSDDAIKRLAQYWFRASMMRKLTHKMLDKYLMTPITKRSQAAFEKRFGEFDTYTAFWLSGLFVVVEGFNRLKMYDARVQKLFKENVDFLKQVRHETYHYSDKGLSFSPMIGKLNWAEELHDAIGEVIMDTLHRKSTVERFIEYRTTRPLRRDRRRKDTVRNS
jgi:hypothetical protein